MIPKGILVILLMFCCINLSAQNKQSPLEVYESTILNKTLSVNEKKVLLDSVLQFAAVKVNQDTLAHKYHGLLKAFLKKNIDVSIGYALKIKMIGEATNNTNEFYQKNYKNLVYLYFKNGQYYKAINYGKQFLKQYPEETFRQAVVYRVLGNSYAGAGDFKEAFSHYTKAIFLFKDYQNIKEEGRTIINLLGAYVKLDNATHKNDVLELIKRIDDISQQYQFSKTETLKKELNIGGFYDLIEDYKNAKTRYSKSLQLSTELADSLNICKSLINIGILNKKENNLEASIATFNKATSYAKYNHEKRASLYNNLADVYKEKKQYNEALTLYNKAIIEFLQVDDATIFVVPKIEELDALENKVDLLGYVIDKANTLLYFDDSEDENKYLKLALKLYALSDKIIDIIYFESREDFSKLFWREEASDLYLNATEVAYKLNDPNTAFYFTEKSKALLLLESITNNKAKALASLPEQLIDKEYALLSTIKETENELSTFKQTYHNKEKIDSLKNVMFSRKQDYTLFVDSLEIEYPRYYNYKRKIKVFDSKMAQESMQEDELIIQYKINANKSFVIVLSKFSEDVFELQNMNQISKTIDLYSDLISQPFVNNNDQLKFRKISNKLYQYLLPFFNGNNSFFLNKKVIIIPDNKLQYIPFESLVIDTNLELTKSYLLNYCDVSYAYSYSSLMVSSKGNFEKDFFAISPSKFIDTSLATLPVSEKNIQTIEGVLGTEMVVDEEATNEKFLKEYGKSSVVHISTHGGIMDNEPWISFNDKKLMLSDIYFKNQKANLVVLSACKTSHGELKKGEGVMSIARGFISSGSRSVISSLSDINQQSTNEIVTAFYINIKAGYSKSEALRKAKISYINNHKNTSEASPFYWSSLVLIGDVTPIFNNNNSFWYALILVITIFILYVFWRQTYLKKTT